MAKIRIPNQESSSPGWVKPSQGEIFGNLYMTRNIDLSSNRGKIRLSERLSRLYDQGDDNNFGIPFQALRTDTDGTDRWWIFTESGPAFKTSNSDPESTISQDALTGTQTDFQDNAVIFGEDGSGNDRIVAVSGTDLAELSGTTWDDDWWTDTLGQSALDSTVEHHLYVFGNLLLVPDGNVLHVVDDSLVVKTERITIPDEYEITWIADDGFRVYLGAENTQGGDGLIFPWSNVTLGGEETYDTPLDVYSDKTYGAITKDGILHTINQKGQLLAYNGQSMEEVATLPILNKTNLELPDDAIHQNGFDIIDGNINVLIKFTDNILDNMSSGIWEFDPEVGFYHKQNATNYDGSTNDDWGGLDNVNDVGLLKRTSKRDGKMYVGANIYTDQSSNQSVLLVSEESGTTDQRGYIITNQIHSGDVRNFWKRLKLNFRQLAHNNDIIVIKYRVERDPNFTELALINNEPITWSDTDTFTCAEDLSDVKVGYEVEIIRGKGGGATAHVESISESGGTWTVNLDEAIPNVSGTARAAFWDFKKLGTITDNSIQEKLFTIAERSDWIQFKIEMRGREDSPEINSLILEFNQMTR